MSLRIVVINPNSTEAVTTGISRALAPLRMAGGPVIEAVTLVSGPPAIESDADVEGVVEPLWQRIQEEGERAHAFVIACYSDPGLSILRRRSRCPVFGIAECGMLSAMARGQRFGVISILPGSIPRHLRYVRALGLESRLAADRAVGLGVLEVADERRGWEPLCEVGRTLRDEDGADVVLLGCAGMAPYRSRLEQALGLPVIDPTQAAVVAALGSVCIG